MDINVEKQDGMTEEEHSKIIRVGVANLLKQHEDDVLFLTDLKWLANNPSHCMPSWNVEKAQRLGLVTGFTQMHPEIRAAVSYLLRDFDLFKS